MSIFCKDMDNFIEVVYGSAKVGVLFEANAGLLTIQLTGGY